MGFADLSIKDVAEDHQLSVDAVFDLCDRLQIQYTSSATRLALDDVKVIMEFIAHDRGQHDHG
jgi:hypothetical protein